MVSKREIYVGLHCTVVDDTTKTKMNDEYSFAMFLVTLCVNRTICFGVISQPDYSAIKITQQKQHMKIS